MRRAIVGAVLAVAGCSFQPGRAVSDASVSGDGVVSDAPPPPPDAVPPEWAYRRALTIDNTGLGALADLAVAIVLDGTRIDYAVTAAQGADLRFIDGAATQLAYEIEVWNPSGTSVVWVRVPSIAANAMTTIYMYYGNPGASTGANPTAVWDADFVGVWHLVDGHDSTGNLTSTNNNATPIAGKLGPALDFNGASQYVDTGSTTYLSQWTM